MDNTPQSYADRFRSMEEAELIHAARDYPQLVDDAQAAMREEFSRRHMQAPLIEESDESVEPHLVTVKRFRDLSEAIVARSLLEAAGMVAYLYDENLVRLDWQISNFIGGIRLQVMNEDAADALSMLESPSLEPIAFGGGAVFNQPHCPRCDSTSITFEGTSRGPALALLYLVSLPAPLGPATWTCQNCGLRWEEEESVR